MIIRNSVSLTPFDLTKMHEGVVVDTSQFDAHGYVHIVVPELTVGAVPDRATSNQVTINANKIISEDTGLKYGTEILQTNYIACLPIVLNGFTIGSLKPQLGDAVMVYFLDGDVKRAYYFNGHPMKVEELANPSRYVEEVDWESWGYYRIIKLKAKPMTGPDVYKIGHKLHLLGYDVSLDEETGQYFYNNQLYKAVLAFQKRYNLTEDGLVGPITFAMIMRSKAGKVTIQP